MKATADANSQHALYAVPTPENNAWRSKRARGRRKSLMVTA